MAATSPSQRRHEECAEILKAAVPPLVLSPFVLAELDYLFKNYVGHDARLSLLADVAAGAYRLESFNDRDVGQARQIVSQYKDLGVSLADASIVVLAERLSCHEVLTLDERDFRAIRPRKKDQVLRLLPADAT
jgi:predicted nucleic acid-binding protein